MLIWDCLVYKVSIITVVFNNREMIKNAIASVLNQTYKNIEYIVIDGSSDDGTIDVIRSYGKKISKFSSEKDSGIYDAMNKGIRMATGDIVGILNSDDIYIDNFVISKVVMQFINTHCDSLYADLVYVNPRNVDKIIRYYDSGIFCLSRFSSGIMPAHPTFFVKREVYKKYGIFRTDLKIAADFDLMIRFLFCHKISSHYMKSVLVKMSTGGVSTSLSSIWINSMEQLKVCHENGINTNIFKILFKYVPKVRGLFINIK
jgi:glycosyltransferase involved in cell wall biosynthesis